MYMNDQFCLAADGGGRVGYCIKLNNIVRPHLEYCSAVWSPQYVKDKYLLERVQHRFSRMFPELNEFTVRATYGSTSWDYVHLKSVVTGCNRADLLEIFKLIKGLTAVSWSHFFI